VGGGDGVHKIEELDPSAALIMARRHRATGDVEGGKQGRGMPLVVMRLTADGSSVRRLEIALHAFQRLDVRLLIDGKNQRAWPAGGEPSSTPRMRLPVRGVSFGAAPRSPVSASPARRLPA